MSASLVGSEMCIRDRGRWSWSNRSWDLSRKPGTQPATLGGCRAARSWDCLLYTSDAADDM
eukprot:4175509-Alexandrium_andersonii.AAC.1